MPDYGRKLQALGRLLDLRIVRDIIVTEDDDGFWIVGLGRMHDTEGERWMPISLKVTVSELHEILEAVKEQAPAARRTGRWLPW